MTEAIKPTRERLAKGDIVRVLEEDTDGEVVYRYKSPHKNSLDRMLGKGEIDARLKSAGDRFTQDFQAAGMHHMIERRPVLDRVDCANGRDIDSGIDRRREVASVMKIFGPEGTRTRGAVRHVLGYEWTIRHWSDESVAGGWYCGSGVSPVEAKGYVISCLEVLAVHYKVR